MGAAHTKDKFHITVTKPRGNLLAGGDRGCADQPVVGLFMSAKGFDARDASGAGAGRQIIEEFIITVQNGDAVR